MLPNRDNLKAWVAALRSGKYQQAQGVLRTPVATDNHGNHGYCCLGVACDISKLGEWDHSFYVACADDLHDTGLPEAVRAWLGVDLNNPTLSPATDTDHSISAIHANDSLKESFAQIADRIEETYLKGVGG